MEYLKISITLCVSFSSQMQFSFVWDITKDIVEDKRPSSTILQPPPNVQVLLLGKTAEVAMGTESAPSKRKWHH